MDKEYAQILAKVRLERAIELLLEAQELLKKEFYKSANNRAFYAIEKAIKALLAIAEIEVQTHSGTLRQFNFEFIYKGDGTFTQDDYQMIAKLNRKIKAINSGYYLKGSLIVKVLPPPFVSFTEIFPPCV